MRCFRCGAHLPADTRFCGQCGTLVTDPQASTLIVDREAPEIELERVRMVLHGEFDVDRELARGGMGVVYEARELGLNRRVALKVLSFGSEAKARSAERFKREARVVADLEHPNIVPVYRVGDIGGILFISMKLVEGRPLDTIIEEQGALPTEVALHVLRAATRALAYAHDGGIVHRDVKGANLLIDRDGRVMMSDFGVALRASDITLTMDGALIGTPAFMSPEQCGGKRAGPQSDQYSLGIVAFQMLAGVVPFDSDTLAGYVKHHLYSPLPDLRLAREDVPAAFLQIVERALQKDPRDRFPSTRDMLAAVEAIPFSESDRKGSENTLRQLAVGDAVSKIITRELPAIADAATQLMPAPRPWWKQGGFWVTAGAAASVAFVLVARRLRPDTPPASGLAAAESVATPAPPPTVTPQSKPDSVPVARPAALRLLANPASAEILVDGRRVGVGSAIDLRIPSGTRRIQVRATGYQSFDTTVAAGAGALINLGRVALRPSGT